MVREFREENVGKSVIGRNDGRIGEIAAIGEGVAQVELDEGLDGEVQATYETDDPEQRSFEVGPDLVDEIDDEAVYLVEV
ncbi:hypothetical protein HAPAU_32880 [Halalkalicoccus paucihalophilus]|uniref:PRC-barrel domain protein n=1 Tax=Halalkalicoccus paucihalophilus TaxID=1008153 RepID=A0A151A9J0_9EURY|nr:hypothetical protein [Halalkalicoccus paucihalophilus]KYH24305.1 hypothetical protein HAPAU_32880 [Halalkalicoccus paucihalophilus]